jgi:hypothetical protein
VGFLQLSSFEGRLHMDLHRRRLSDADGGSSSSSSSGEAGSLLGSEAQGPRTPSQACVAQLEASGVLAGADGLRLSAKQRQQRAEARRPRRFRFKSHQELDREAAEDRAASVAAEALEAQQARRQLYDGMEQALQETGLALGAPQRPGRPRCSRPTPASCATERAVVLLPRPFPSLLLKFQLPQRGWPPALLRRAASLMPRFPSFLCSLEHHPGHGLGGHVQSGGRQAAAGGAGERCCGAGRERWLALRPAQPDGSCRPNSWRDSVVCRGAVQVLSIAVRAIVMPLLDQPAAL